MADDTLEDVKRSALRQPEITDHPVAISADDAENDGRGEREERQCVTEQGEDAADAPRKKSHADSKGGKKEETDSRADRIVSCEKKCDLAESNSEVTVDTRITEQEEKLNEILKVVHEDLDIKNLRKPPIDRSTVVKDDDDENKDDEEEERTIRTDDKAVADNADSEEGRGDASVAANSAKGNKDWRECSEKIEERSEVGIVGPPTAVCELINEEELGGDSALSADRKDHVAEWVENSVKLDSSIGANAEEEEEDNVVATEGERCERKNVGTSKRGRRKKANDTLALPTRKSQRIVSNIIKKSIKCLNKMHAMEGAGGNGKKVDAAEKTREDESSRASPKVPQNQQNGAALPEEAAAASTTVDRARSVTVKKEPRCDSEMDVGKGQSYAAETSRQKHEATRTATKSEACETVTRKRKTAERQLPANGTPTPKKFCFEQREQYISSLVGCDKLTAEELAARAEQLRAEVQALDELARAKEMEWNEILSLRKLKEEAYLRIERRRQVISYMEENGRLTEPIPPASLSLGPGWENSENTSSASKEKTFGSKDDLSEGNCRKSPTLKREKSAKVSQQQAALSKTSGGENDRKQSETSSPENRQIGEGRQGAIVDVRSIIADYRLRHPETVPRRGRRMRNSVNVGLGAGGAMVETGHNVDSRPSSTDSCKSNPNATDSNNSMSFKDVLVQFAKLSQQQGEPVKTPQNYPDVTLHPVAPSTAPQNTSSSQQTGSLLHGILTKSQSPRPTTFSPTLARLLTAPERERNAPVVAAVAAAAAAAAASMPQQSMATQHLLQAYQGSNLVSISDLLSSSKARTEITITPVVNTPAQSHSNNLIHVEDVEEETTVIDDRETKFSTGGRDSREDRDNPPRCQGCHERAAQFVCAGCGNQWYCSRECQVAAWDEHSEVCSG